MTRKIASYIICLTVLFGAIFSELALAEVSVGVKEGDFIGYQVTYSGDVPQQHDVNWAKIEVISIQDKKIEIAITSRYSDGKEETVTATLNLETGQIGDCFIIPGNLDEGDIFLEQTEGTITISDVEEKTYADAKRTVVTASSSHTTFYWDRSTGFLVEATSQYPIFTLTTKAEKTNIWQPQTFGLDPLLSIVLIVIAIVLVLAILLRRKI
ncbi:hypothetical protein MUO98_06735 [Candidatus Bathyarchaeota archaeon]|nr:hypothetical protein [Candidatus Bathyarchaeota archaeon]